MKTGNTTATPSGISFAYYIARRVAPFALFFFALQTGVRILFLLREISEIDQGPWEYLKMFAVGFSFDMAAFAYLLIPYVLYFVLLPVRLHRGRLDRILTTMAFCLAVFVVLFSAFAEWFFWDEFSVRFNFIAVDYLVYTTEVLANIWESYPISWLVSALIMMVVALYWGARRFLIPDVVMRPTTFLNRLAQGLVILLFPVLSFFGSRETGADISANAYVNELAKNGLYSLFSAFRNNELNYDSFYLTEYADAKLPPIRSLLTQDNLGQVFTGDDPDDITRFVPGRGPEKHKNVVIVVMESMNASFMGRFGWPGGGITPNLDRLANEALFFDRTYATGTRTVRGLEAITLSVPPTPGRSILKRPNNENLASIGFVFRDRDYDTRFLYGGYGYFDNMNTYFENNGFDIVDRGAFTAGEQTFANAWGLCDEDIYRKVISEAGKSYAAHRSFMHIVMTTSNHRPYTFPPGRPGIPAKGGGRTAGVKYADYALGKFLAEAREEPWFKDTVFIVIADHTAGSAGKQELAVDKYHIPFLIYSPGFVAPRVVRTDVSQVDVMPILLGLLDFSYVGRFYGRDVLKDLDDTPRAFIANYQKLGYLEGKNLAILEPGNKAAEYLDGKKVSAPDFDLPLLLKSIAIYKHASHWRDHISRVDTIPGATRIARDRQPESAAAHRGAHQAP